MCAHLCITTLKTSVRQRTYCSAVKPAEPQKSRETEHSQPAAEKHNHKIFYLPNSIHLLLILEGIIIQLSSLISLYHEQESFLQLSQIQPEACTWQHLCPEKHLKRVTAHFSFGSMFQQIILKNNMQDCFSLSEGLTSAADIASCAALLPQIEECFRISIFSLQMYLHINQVNPPSP